MCACTVCVLSKLQGQHPFFCLVQLLYLGLAWFGGRDTSVYTDAFGGLQHRAYAPCSPGPPSENAICMFSGTICSSEKSEQSLEKALCCSEQLPPVWSCGLSLPQSCTDGSVMWSWAFSPHLVECSSVQEWVLDPVVYWSRKRWGDNSWESGSGLNLHMLEVVKGLHVFTEASLFLVLGGVHLMEDMLRSVSQLFIAQKKNVCALPSVVAYTTFFSHNEILHSCKLARKLDNKAVSQSKVLACPNCW